MRPATARAIEVARRQRARTACRAQRRKVIGASALILFLALVWTSPLTVSTAFDAYYRYQERRVFEEEKAEGGCNPYTGYCGPEAFDEEWENQQP